MFGNSLSAYCQDNFSLRREAPATHAGGNLTGGAGKAGRQIGRKNSMILTKNSITSDASSITKQKNGNRL
jgi:hypothetical protein